MKTRFVSILAVVALASCSTSDFENTFELSTDPIKLTVGADGMIGAGTRAPYIAPIGVSNTLTAVVVPTTSNTDFSTFYSSVTSANFNSYTMTWQNDDGVGTQGTAANLTNARGFSTTLYYPSDPATPVYLSGLYPSAGWAFNSGVFAHTFDGKTDVMYASTVSTIKPDATPAATPNYQTLVFKHALTLLDIQVVASNIDAVSLWGDITQMEVTKALTSTPNTTVSIAFPATGTPYKPALSVPAALNVYKMNAADTYDDLQIVKTDNTSYITLSTTATYAAYSMVTPIDAISGSVDGGYTIKVYTANRPAGVEVPITLTLTNPAETYTGGKKFTVTLTFQGQEIKATATVMPWTNAGSGSGIVL